MLNWTVRTTSSFGQFIHLHSKKDRRRIRTLSLFSGAGGLDIGFHDAGFDIVEAVELDPKLAASLQANVGEGKYFGSSVNIVVGDICDYNPDLEDIDFIIGGPPCQTFSAAGARASGVAGTKDVRGNLFQEYVRILEKLKPSGFLFENVYRILGANGGEDWREIIQAFSKVGYDLSYRVLDTADYGVPQNRERLIIVGVRKDADDLFYKFPRPTHGIDSLSGRKPSSGKQAVRGINEAPDKVSLNGRYGHLLKDIPPGLNYSFFTEKMGHPNPIFAWRSKFSDFLYKADPEEPVRTIKAQGGQYTGPFHWNSRPFSKQEYKRLQTFPDCYEMIGSKATVVKQIGNSVPPQFARVLALSIRQQVFKRSIPIEISTIDESFQLRFRKIKSARTAKYKATANKAIAEISKRSSPTTDALPCQFNYSLTDNFSMSIDAHGDRSCVISSSDEFLKFDVVKNDKSENVAIIEVKPVVSWALPVERVLLSFDISDWKSFTASWKIFELYLSRNGYKADLEQLSGYYQYRSRIKCALKSQNALAFNEVDTAFLKEVVSGKLTQRKVSAVDISKETNTTQDKVFSQLKALKSFGYAIRNSNTNVAMGKDVYLIPYPFPTLNPLSVQLNKEF